MNENEKEFEDARIEQIVFGWNSVDEAAKDIFASLHRNLLEGTPVFLYKSTSRKSDLVQIAIVANILDYDSMKYSGDYGIGIITAGYSAYYPKMPLEYLEKEILEDLEGWKVEKSVIDVYKKIIKALKDNDGK